MQILKTISDLEDVLEQNGELFVLKSSLPDPNDTKKYKVTLLKIQLNGELESIYSFDNDYKDLNGFYGLIQYPYLLIGSKDQISCHDIKDKHLIWTQYDPSDRKLIHITGPCVWRRYWYYIRDGSRVQELLHSLKFDTKKYFVLENPVRIVDRENLRIVKRFRKGLY